MDLKQVMEIFEKHVHFIYFFSTPNFASCVSHITVTHIAEFSDHYIIYGEGDDQLTIYKDYMVIVKDEDEIVITQDQNSICITLMEL